MVMSVLSCRFERLLALVGIVCSSWVVVNAGTSQRDFLTPMGDCERRTVVSGNLMAARPQSCLRSKCET